MLSPHYLGNGPYQGEDHALELLKPTTLDKIKTFVLRFVLKLRSVHDLASSGNTHHMWAEQV